MQDNNELLQPGVSIKPKVSLDEAKKLINDNYGLKCVSLNKLNGYDDYNYHVLVENNSDNINIKCVQEVGYILKIINSLDSKKVAIFEAQTKLLLHLGENSINCPKPVKTKNGEYFFLQTFSSGTHLVRFFKYIEGVILHNIDYCSPNLFQQIGKYVAKLDKAIKTFHHPAYNTYKTLWMLESVPQLSQFLFAIKNSERKKLVEEIIYEFTNKVLAVSNTLEKGIIHGDFNEQNVIVDKNSANGEWYVKAILDFGDSHYACYLFELAITMTYMMLETKSIEFGGHVLAGYVSIRQLPEIEYQLLKICIAARLCQSLVMGAYSSLQDPDNSYILTTSKTGWNLLEEIWSQSEDNLLRLWKNVQNITTT